MSSPPSSFRITVNGTVHDLTADASTPLLYVLRNDLGLIAAKYGCGFGRCGACTVHLDGEAVYSCMLPVGEIAGRKVTTLEGLSEPGHLHRLQQALLDEQAAQCGYCVPGIVMTAAALLDINPSPTDPEIRVALEGALCRCGSHTRILRAIRRIIESPTSED
jgi:aerobic-type carbon monoxide dehydrogenase small subunit (CoxS/CutS family)